MPDLPRSFFILLLCGVAAISGCAAKADATSGNTVVASTSPEASLCQQVIDDIDGLEGTATAEEFRDFSAAIANKLRDHESTVGVDLAIANSYAMLLGIDVSAYANPQHRLSTAMDFVNALDTYVAGCQDLGVTMPQQWTPPETANGPRSAGGHSSAMS